VRLINAGELSAEKLANPSDWRIQSGSVAAFEERRDRGRRLADKFSRSLDDLGAPLECAARDESRGHVGSTRDRLRHSGILLPRLMAGLLVASTRRALATRDGWAPRSTIAYPRLGRAVAVAQPNPQGIPRVIDVACGQCMRGVLLVLARRVITDLPWQR
jgi:hypothetical protein